jgi:hypothetical protein
MTRKIALRLASVPVVGAGSDRAAPGGAGSGQHARATSSMVRLRASQRQPSVWARSLLGRHSLSCAEFPHRPRSSLPPIPGPIAEEGAILPTFRSSSSCASS